MYSQPLWRLLIPPRTYPAQDISVHTVGIDLVAFCIANLNMTLVYEFARAYFEDTLENIGKQTDPQAPAVVIPAHPEATVAGDAVESIRSYS